MGDPTDIMTGDRLADTIRTVRGAMHGASALQVAALDRLLAHVRATEALTAAHRPSAGGGFGLRVTVPAPPGWTRRSRTVARRWTAPTRPRGRCAARSIVRLARTRRLRQRRRAMPVGDDAIVSCAYPGVPLSDEGTARDVILCVHYRVDSSLWPAITGAFSYRVGFSDGSARWLPGVAAEVRDMGLPSTQPDASMVRQAELRWEAMCRAVAMDKEKAPSIQPARKQTEPRERR